MDHFEAICLDAMNYQESSVIATVFSKQFGLFSIIHKRSSYQTAKNLSPLVKFEGVIQSLQKDLVKCSEVNIVCSYQALRLHIKKLEMAAFLLKFLKEHLPRKEPLPILYDSLDDHLQHMESCLCPQAVAASFILKFHEEEGILFHDDATMPFLVATLDEVSKLTCSDELFQKIAKEGT